MCRARVLILGLGALLIVSCTSGRSMIESKLSPDFSGTMTRLFIAVGHSEVNADYATHFAREIAARLSEYGVNTQYVVFAQKSGDNVLHDWFPVDTLAVKEFDPDGVLVVQEVSSIRPGKGFGYDFSELSHDASLFVDSWVTRMWRATIDTYGSRVHGQVISKDNLKEAAKTLVSQMQTDGILP